MMQDKVVADDFGKMSEDSDSDDWYIDMIFLLWKTLMSTWGNCYRDNINPQERPILFLCDVLICNIWMIQAKCYLHFLYFDLFFFHGISMETFDHHKYVFKNVFNKKKKIKSTFYIKYFNKYWPNIYE